MAHATPSRRRLSAARPLRLLTAVPLCDGHDSAITTINQEFVRHGIEVIYLGYHRSVGDVVRAAIQEDVRAIGLSSYNGGHVEFFADVARRLRKQGAGDIGLFGGGGGTITHQDAALMHRRGVDRIFFPGTPLEEMVQWVLATYSRHRKHRTIKSGRSEVQIAAMLTAAQRRPGGGTHVPPAHVPHVVGIAGPGGAGKTTLIDELALRFLNSDPHLRLAILCHDPSLIGRGALLGDRAAMIHSQSDRVFLRSLATQGQSGGLSATTGRCLRVLRGLGRFDLILIETVGIGQESFPFGRGLVDTAVMVMSPTYGSRLQLQKIVALDAADIVVVNKSDLPGAPAASNEIEQRLAANARGQKLVATTAKRHRDAGVDALFEVLRQRARDLEHA